MDAWWQTESTKAPEPVRRPQAVAYYRHSAQDRQENSVPIQREQVCRWAELNGITVIQEFADHGKSGLSADHRDAFNDMLENWVKKRDDFEFVLVLDVSRWGRFQDIDLSATYSAECTRHGKQVVYTSLGLPKKNDPLHAVVIGFERYRAAQYSRELSDKVFRGCAKIAEQGFRGGGIPPYGFHRLLLNEAHRPVQVLKPGERKSIQNQRVTLTPGNSKEVAVVRRIFEEFTHQRQDEQNIADGLNRSRIPSAGGAKWDVLKVRTILMNEIYAGTMIYNKSTQRLLSPPRRNPREDWIRTPEAFRGIVSGKLFERAQDMFRERERRRTPEYLLEQLQKVYATNGVITPRLVQAATHTRSIYAYHKHFRGLGSAFQRIFQDTRSKIVRMVRARLEEISPLVEDHSDFFLLNKKLTVLVQPSVPVPKGYRSYWHFRPDTRPAVDITLGVPLSGTQDPMILGYLAFPRLLAGGRAIRVADTRDCRIEVFGHNGLDFIRDLLT